MLLTDILARIVHAAHHSGKIPERDPSPRALMIRSSIARHAEILLEQAQLPREKRTMSMVVSSWSSVVDAQLAYKFGPELTEAERQILRDFINGV